MTASTPTKWHNNGIAKRDRVIRRLLGALESYRPLNIDEQAELKRLAKTYPPAKRLNWSWTPSELRKIDTFIIRNARSARPKPFREDKRVRDLAAELGRSYEATHKMIQRRRKANCPRACNDGKE